MNFRNRISTLLASTVFAAIAAAAPMTATASMALSNAIVHFEPGEPSRQDVEITNTGDQPLYVQIDPRVVLQPGTASEQRVAVTDPREHGLLVTPNRLVIAPGASRALRLVKLAKQLDEERIFRVTARPVSGELEAESSGLKILIGYEVLAIFYPDKPNPDLQVTRSGRKLKVVNNGNTNVLLQEGFQCATPDTELEDCTPLPGKRMYPGTSWEVDLPHDLPVRYYQSVGTRNFVETYP